MNNFKQTVKYLFLGSFNIPISSNRSQLRTNEIFIFTIKYLAQVEVYLLRICIDCSLPLNIFQFCGMWFLTQLFVETKVNWMDLACTPAASRRRNNHDASKSQLNVDYETLYLEQLLCSVAKNKIKCCSS